MGITTMLKATKKQDEWMTPRYAIKPLLSFLPNRSRILCPFDHKDSWFVYTLKEAGHYVQHSHINDVGCYGKDFFTYTKGEVKPYNFIVSNPPYSQKDAVFEKLFELGRPFCMLMGATAGLFEGKRFQMWTEHYDQLKVIWLSPRVSYIDQSGAAMKSPPFQSCYVCWKLPIAGNPGHLFARVEK